MTRLVTSSRIARPSRAMPASLRWTKTQRFLLIALFWVSFSSPAADSAESSRTQFTYVIVHGAGAGGWSWKVVGESLAANGHTVYRPTLTGLGERVHLATPDTGLTTHIDDIVNIIQFEKLSDIVLVGHSYGGMVITGVMDRIPERLAHVIFLDAPVPDDGMAGTDVWKSILGKSQVKDGKIYFPWLDTNPPYPREVPQPLKTFTEPVAFKNPDAMHIRATFVAFVNPGRPLERRKLDPSWKRAESRGWEIRTMNSDHNANSSHPEELARLLIELPLSADIR